MAVYVGSRHDLGVGGTPVSTKDENSPSGETETNVTEFEINRLLEEAENFNFDDTGRFVLLAWIELAVDVFQRMVGEPQRPVL